MLPWLDEPMIRWLDDVALRRFHESMIRCGNGSMSRQRFRFPSPTSIRHIPELCRRRGCHHALPQPFLLRPLPTFKLRMVPEQTSNGILGPPFRSGWSCVRIACCRVLVSEGSADPSQPVCCDVRAQSKKANEGGTQLWEQLHLSYPQAGPPPESTGAPRAWRALP